MIHRLLACCCIALFLLGLLVMGGYCWSVVAWHNGQFPALGAFRRWSFVGEKGGILVYRDHRLSGEVNLAYLAGALCLPMIGYGLWFVSRLQRQRRGFSPLSPDK